ncbi:MAG TPA: class I SAM-dependent methyltransferase [Candidatus Limnocylindria bacterium]|nr:class I SAM-dependent methyltransferase [Candidatus Limnocylindria bacterium]
MGRSARGGRRSRRGVAGLSDILAGQPADEALLAELYDLEHDEIDEDRAFYREWARRTHGATIDLGCGSGRLFGELLRGGARKIVGIDGSQALLDRALVRMLADDTLRAARDDGRIELSLGDVRTVRHPHRFRLAILAGVIAHLEGPEEALRALIAAGRLLQPEGVLIVDTIGPGGLPEDDLPLSIDWQRQMGDRRVVRRSRLARHESPEGLRVDYFTLTDVIGPDGTIARLPAAFRLWYPSPSALVGLAEEAQLTVDAAYGSHDLEPLAGRSQRCILVLRRNNANVDGG